MFDSVEIAKKTLTRMKMKNTFDGAFSDTSTPFSQTLWESDLKDEVDQLDFSGIEFPISLVILMV